MRSNLHMKWAELFASSLSASGVREVVVSPGSRSTPLALAFSRLESLRVHVIADERAAAFFALGQARFDGAPSALLCTSGSAGAHYFPAVVEASETNTPLIAITADRPWELAHAAAPQTIDQRRLFGDFARFDVDLGEPVDGAVALRGVQRIVAQAVARARGPVPGPVHVNARFRKPLEPIDLGEEAWDPMLRELLAKGPPRVFASETSPSDEAIDFVTRRIAGAERCVVVAGPSSQRRGVGRMVFELARRIGAPLLAEATSQLRFAEDPDRELVVAHIDALLGSRSFRAAHAPDLVLQLGAPPTSSAYATWLEENPGAEVVCVREHGYPDAQNVARAIVLAHPHDLAGRVCRSIEPRATSRWAESWLRADAIARSIVRRELEGSALSEGVVAREVVDACPRGGVLFVGNSSPVRDLDFACEPVSRDLRVLHQRGASGIDGLVAGAAGSKSVTDRPLALLLGDVSLRHDIGSLGLIAASRAPLVVVVVDNGGGRIFDRLPIARAIEGEELERLFATPAEVDFSRAAAAFGVAYERCEDVGALRSSLARAFAATAPILIHAVVPRREGAAILARVASALERELGAEKGRG